jgi:molecular chaperone GrpE (heat shock protein)
MKVVIAVALLGLGLSGCADLNQGLFDKKVLEPEPAPAVTAAKGVDETSSSPKPTTEAFADDVAMMEQGSVESEKSVVSRKPPKAQQKPASKSQTPSQPKSQTKSETKPQPKTPPEAKAPAPKKPAEKAVVESPRTASSKDQCMTQYPMKTGQLARRQQCINSLASKSAAKMNASQKAIVSDCSRKLLTLADSADKSAISLNAYNAKKQQLRGECNSAIRKAAAGTPAKSTKTASTRDAAAKKPVSATASKTANTKASGTTSSAAKSR